MRHELKYVENLAVAEQFMEEAAEFCEIDQHAGPDGYYETTSIYYDSESLRFFWDRQESLGYRRKVRLRTYDCSSNNSQIFFEIKEKHKNLVSKKRCNLNLKDIQLDLSTSENLLLVDLIPHLENSIAKDEIEYLDQRLNLKPIVNVRYVRKALAARCDPTLRITLDKRLTTMQPSLSPYNCTKEQFFLDPGLSVLEIKSENSLPLWLVSMIQRYEFTRSRFSKYCAAVEKLFLDLDDRNCFQSELGFPK